MAEYIEREAVVMGILGLTIVDPMVAQYADAVLMQIQQASAADVMEVKRGRWVDIYNGKYANQAYRCSVCGKSAHDEDGKRWILSDFCPNCGARMEVDNETD